MRLAFIFLVFAFLCSPLQGCYPLCGFAGSYPCAQSWELKIKKTELISIIKAMKTEKPELQPPGDTALVKGQEHYWFFINFYYPDTKEIVHTWIRESTDPRETTLAFTGLSDPGSSGSFRRINDDYNWAGNAKQINKFKRLILDPIREKINSGQ